MYYGCYYELEGLAWRPCCLTAVIRRLHKGWRLCLHKGLMYSALFGFLIVSPLQIFQVPPKRTEERGRQVFKYSHVCFCGLVRAAWSFLGDVFLYPQADYVRNAGEAFHFKVSEWWDESCSWLSWHEFNAGRHIQIGYVVAEDSHALVWVTLEWKCPICFQFYIWCLCPFQRSCPWSMFQVFFFRLHAWRFYIATLIPSEIASSFFAEDSYSPEACARSKRWCFSNS
jgi:hypothetical protein